MPSEPLSPLPNLVHNGRHCHASEARIAVTDGAIRLGQGIFETLAVYRGRPFLAQAHLDRLRHAAARLDLHCPSDSILLDAMGSVLDSSGMRTDERSRLRITLTSPASRTPDSSPTTSESWFVEASPSPDHRERASVMTVPFVRNERSALAGLKTINYGENVIAQRLAREAGADEALFGNTLDCLCEGTWSNIFVYHEGGFLTPPLDSGCLPGVTRALVLELCRGLGITVREAVLSMDRLAEIEAAFLTSSLREIQVISFLNGRPLSDPPGVAAIRDAYRKRVEAECWTIST